MTSATKDLVIESAPSVTETEHFRCLLTGGAHNLVMVKCLFEGVERVGIGRMVRESKGGEPQLMVLAILTNETDNLQVATRTGEFFTPLGVVHVFN